MYEWPINADTIAINVSLPTPCTSEMKIGAEIILRSGRWTIHAVICRAILALSPNRCSRKLQKLIQIPGSERTAKACASMSLNVGLYVLMHSAPDSGSLNTVTEAFGTKPRRSTDGRIAEDLGRMAFEDGLILPSASATEYIFKISANTSRPYGWNGVILKEFGCRAM